MHIISILCHEICILNADLCKLTFHSYFSFIFTFTCSILSCNVRLICMWMLKRCSKGLVYLNAYSHQHLKFSKDALTAVGIGRFVAGVTLAMTNRIPRTLCRCVTCVSCVFLLALVQGFLPAKPEACLLFLDHGSTHNPARQPRPKGHTQSESISLFVRRTLNLDWLSFSFGCDAPGRVRNADSWLWESSHFIDLFHCGHAVQTLFTGGFNGYVNMSCSSCFFVGCRTPAWRTLL